MAEIIPLPKSTQEELIIDRLKTLLAEAEDGNLSQIAFVGLFNDGTLMECITIERNMYELLGSLNVLQQRVSLQMMEATQAVKEELH